MSNTTIRDVQSVEMAGYIESLELFEEWQQEFFSPAIVDYFRAIMAQLTPDQHQQLAAMDPETHARVMQYISGLGGK